MKTILITVGHQSVLHTTIRTRILELLRERAPHARCVCIAQPSLVQAVRDIVPEGVEVREMPGIYHSAFSRFMHTIARNGLPTGTLRVMQKRTRAKGEGGLPFPLKRLVAQAGYVRIFHTLVRFLDTFVATPDAVKKLFDDLRPDLVYATMVYDEDTDIPLMREARRRGIRTLGLTRSWDNPTAHGIVRVVPDVFVAQNAHIKDMARRWHGIQSGDPVGIPYTDWYVDESGYVPRDVLCGYLGLDPAKKIVMYGPAGGSLYPREVDVAEEFQQLIRNHEWREPVQVLIRPHPWFPMQVAAHGADVIIDTDGVERMPETSLVQKRPYLKPLVHFINVFRHVDAIITTGSTSAIDCMIFDKPAVFMGYDALRPEPYWQSVARLPEYFDHLKALITYGDLPVAADAETLAAEVAAALNDPKKGSDARRVVRERFVGPLDGKSCDRLVGVIVKEVG